MLGAIPPLPNTPSWRGAQLKQKHRDNLTFITQAVNEESLMKPVSALVDGEFNINERVQCPS
jgi:hypothetical protein